MKDRADNLAGALIGMFIGAVLGFLIGVAVMADIPSSLKQQAIERGFAEYNSKTGEWQWKETGE